VDGGHGFAVEAEGGERLTFGGGTVLIKAATAGFTVWEELPPLLDTPLHVHEQRTSSSRSWKVSTCSSVVAIGSTSALGPFSRFLVECHMDTDAWCKGSAASWS
jgi:hypothetical protein